MQYLTSSSLGTTLQGRNYPRSSSVWSRLLLSLGLILLSFASASAQLNVTVSPTYPAISTFLWGNTSVNAVGKTSFVSGTGYGYRYILPKNFNANTKYPAIIFLHGDGEDGTDNNAQLAANYNTANGVLALVSTANPATRRTIPVFSSLLNSPPRPFGPVTRVRPPFKTCSIFSRPSIRIRSTRPDLHHRSVGWRNRYL